MAKTKSTKTRATTARAKREPGSANRDRSEQPRSQSAWRAAIREVERLAQQHPSTPGDARPLALRAPADEIERVRRGIETELIRIAPPPADAPIVAASRARRELETALAHLDVLPEPWASVQRAATAVATCAHLDDPEFPSIAVSRVLDAIVHVLRTGASTRGNERKSAVLPWSSKAFDEFASAANRLLSKAAAEGIILTQWAPADRADAVDTLLSLTRRLRKAKVPRDLIAWRLLTAAARLLPRARGVRPAEAVVTRDRIETVAKVITRSQSSERIVRHVLRAIGVSDEALKRVFNYQDHPTRRDREMRRSTAAVALLPR